MEREPEQPLLAARRHEVADVEEGRAAPLAALEHLDRAALLDDVEPPGLALRAGDVDRLREAAREDARLELGLSGAAAAPQAAVRATMQTSAIRNLIASQR